MQQMYVEPREPRDFGGVLTAIVAFFKHTHRSLFTIFLTYNFLFIVASFVINYMVDSGVGSIVSLASGGIDDYLRSTQDTETTVLIGTVLQLLLSLLVILMQAGLAAAILKAYERHQQPDFDGRSIFTSAMQKMGGNFLILFIGGCAFLPAFIVMVLAAIVPIIGIFFMLIVMLTYFNWIGFSLFAYAYEDDINVTEAMGLGWKLIFSKFWKGFGVTFMAGVVLYVLALAFQIIPAALIGIYSYNSALDAEAISSSTFVVSLKFIFYALNSITGIVVQFVVFFVIGFNYLNLHEERFKVYLRQRIAKIEELA